MKQPLDLVVIGAGPAGMMAAIRAAELGRKVLLLDAQPRVGRKLLASGGGRCNLTNTLPVDALAERFGAARRFVRPALQAFGPDALRDFLAELGVPTHAPDGLRVFPVDHRAASVHTALLQRLDELGVDIETHCSVNALRFEHDRVSGVRTENAAIDAAALLVACGGRGYPSLGGSEIGYDLASQAGHRIEPPSPAMVPLRTRENWPARCTSHTLGKARVVIDVRGGSSATGDLIFTREGLAGPVILDLARDVGQLLLEHESVRLRINASGHSDAQHWQQVLRDAQRDRASLPLATLLTEFVPPPLAQVLAELAGADPTEAISRLGKQARHQLAEQLAWLRLEVVDTAGWEQAMVTRGGVSRREIDPTTLASVLRPGLYFAGEVIDVDGPCGGFNLQWAFASGRLVGQSVARALDPEESS